jgi:hypothetical protein
MFGTKGVETVEGSSTSKYFSYGVNKAKIVDLKLVKSPSSPNQKLEVWLEGEPVTEKGFVGVDGARGKVGKLVTYWLREDKHYQDLLRQIGIIADKLGVRKEIDEISVNSVSEFGQYLQNIKPYLCGKYLWWVIGADYYSETRYKLLLVKFNFVKSPSEVDESSLVVERGIPVQINLTSGGPALFFNKDNRYHFRPFEKADAEESAPSASSFKASGPTENLFKEIADSNIEKKEDNLPF